MDESRFFKTVWRFNSIVILAAGLAAMVVIGIIIVESLIRHDRPHQVITNVATDPEGDEKWQLGYPRDVTGTPYVYIPLISEKEYVRLKESALGTSGLHSYAKSGISSPTRNILFVNGERNEQRWLFPSNAQLVVDIDQLGEHRHSAGCPERCTTMAIEYRVVKRDTNGDKKLTRDDLSIVAFTRPDGSGYTEVVSEADRVVSSTTINGGKVLLIYQVRGTGYSATVSLKDFSIISKKELPKVAKAP